MEVIVFYNFIMRTLQLLLHLLNGKPTIINAEYINRTDNYILIAPHTTWLDPIFLATCAFPKQFCFMAKKELFKVPVLKWMLPKVNAFPVDRQNPGPSTIKIPVNHLKQTQLSLVIFPSGSRHTSDIKEGAAMISRLSKCPIIPVLYEGPKNFQELIFRKKATLTFQSPIYITTKEEQTAFSTTIENLFKGE